MTTETINTESLTKPARIKKIQTLTLVLLFLAGIVNFLDRSSLSVAGEAIRGDMGLSATEFGFLLSAFSLSYGLAQLPSGILLDRYGPRLVLGAGVIFLTGSWWPIVAMMVVYSLIGLVSAFLMPEVRDRDLSLAEDAAEKSVSTVPLGHTVNQ